MTLRTEFRFNPASDTCGVLRRSSVQSWLLLYLRRRVTAPGTRCKHARALDVVAGDERLDSDDGLPLPFSQLRVASRYSVVRRAKREGKNT